MSKTITAPSQFGNLRVTLPLFSWEKEPACDERPQVAETTVSSMVGAVRFGNNGPKGSSDSGAVVRDTDSSLSTPLAEEAQKNHGRAPLTSINFSLLVNVRDPGADMGVANLVDSATSEILDEWQHFSRQAGEGCMSPSDKWGN